MATYSPALRISLFVLDSENQTCPDPLYFFLSLCVGIFLPRLIFSHIPMPKGFESACNPIDCFSIIMIRPAPDLRNHFADISKAVHETGEPLFLTKNGYGDMVGL